MRSGAKRALVAVGTASLLLGAACSGGSTADDSSGASDQSLVASPGTAGSSVPAANPNGARGGAPIARYAGFSTPQYTDQANWLCGPGAAADDRCLRQDLDTTVIRADGSTEITYAPARSNPPFDCFYVYPTVGFGSPTGNDLEMAADTNSEDAVIEKQAARLRTQCRIYAPLYRQTTGAGDAAMAYGDVRDAWKQNMAHWNEGRPFLLMGHSQGSGMLQRLMVDEIDGDAEVRGRMIAAWLLGGSAMLPADQKVGGTFKNIPACTEPTQNGCVVGFNSVAAGGPDSDRERWGRSNEGEVKLCTNPAALAGGSTKLTPIYANREVDPAAKPWITGKPSGTVTTPFVELPDLVTAGCRTQTITRADGTTVTVTALEYSPTAAAGDVRDLDQMLTPGPGFWALHIQEAQLTMRNLLDLLSRQSAHL
jgi:hypothetical protein